MTIYTNRNLPHHLNITLPINCSEDLLTLAGQSLSSKTKRTLQCLPSIFNHCHLRRYFLINWAMSSFCEALLTLEPNLLLTVSNVHFQAFLLSWIQFSHELPPLDSISKTYNIVSEQLIDRPTP